MNQDNRYGLPEIVYQKPQTIKRILSTYTATPANVVKLISPRTRSEVYLLGTSHISEKSVEEVRQLIRYLNPQTVAAELCLGRLGIIFAKDEGEEEKEGKSDADYSWLLTQPSSTWLAKILTTFYERAVKDLNIGKGSVGREFRVAFEEARRIGAHYALADRPVEITLRRMWASLSLLDRISLALHLICGGLNFELTAEDVERMKNSDILTEMIKEIAGQFPSLLNSILHERDLFLTYNIRRCPGPVVVAVVGLGHIQGIVDNWDKTIDIEEISRSPGPGPWYYKWICGGMALSLLGGSIASTYVLFKYVPRKWLIGGIAGIIASGYIYSRYSKVRVSHMLDQMEARAVQ